jgi:hypothetical protein
MVGKGDCPKVNRVPGSDQRSWGIEKKKRAPTASPLGFIPVAWAVAKRCIEEI